ncbi:MAG: hypothetical protein U0359_37440 [Byssovorax sp.]
MSARRPSIDARTRGLAAFAAGAACAILAYAMQRAVERLFFPEPNPAVIIWSERSPFLWRALFSLYFGGLGGFGGFVLAGRRAGRSLGWLPALIGAAAIAIVLQAGLAP